jgi:hypothetical protein
MFRNSFIFYGEGLLAPCPTPKLKDHTHCRLFAADYSMHSQLPSTAGASPSIRRAVVIGP